MTFDEVEIEQFVVVLHTKIPSEVGIVVAKHRKRVSVVTTSDCWRCRPGSLESSDPPNEAVKQALALEADRHKKEDEDNKECRRREKACITELGSWWHKLTSHPCKYHDAPEVIAILDKHGFKFGYSMLTVWLEKKA